MNVYRKTKRHFKPSKNETKNFVKKNRRLRIREEHVMNSLLGDKCQFAHGRRELRDVVRNTKYKTKTCQKYWKVGYCAYGPRCNFLHDELDEQTLMDWNSLYNGK